MYRSDVIIQSGAITGRAWRSDVGPLIEGAELTVALHWEIWLQRRRRGRGGGDLYSLSAHAPSFQARWSDFVILTPRPAGRQLHLSLYIESIKAKTHFIRSLQMYINLERSLRGLRHIYAETHMRKDGDAWFAAVLVQSPTQFPPSSTSSHHLVF